VSRQGARNWTRSGGKVKTGCVSSDKQKNEQGDGGVQVGKCMDL